MMLLAPIRLKSQNSIIVIADFPGLGRKSEMCMGENINCKPTSRKSPSETSFCERVSSDSSIILYYFYCLSSIRIWFGESR